MIQSQSCAGHGSGSSDDGQKWIPILDELVVPLTNFDLGQLEGEFVLGKVEAIHPTATGLDIAVTYPDYPRLGLLWHRRRELRPSTDQERATWATQRITRGFAC